VPSYDFRDPLFVAMTFEEVVEETGRSERTIQRWVQQRRLTAYRASDGQMIFVRRDVLTVEAETSQRPGRPGPRPPTL
jgi:predicted site-specific integrase-resolvase